MKLKNILKILGMMNLDADVYARFGECCSNDAYVPLDELKLKDLENGIVDFDKKYILKLKSVVNTDGKLPKLYIQLDEENENWKF